MRGAILAGATRFWAKSPHWVMIVFDKLLQYKIVEPTDVVDFVFSPSRSAPAVVMMGTGDDALSSFSRLRDGAVVRDWSAFTWWDIIRLCVEKVNGRVDQVRRRLAKLEREEAEARERKEAQEAAGENDGKNDQIDVDPTPAPSVFPTSASLPSKPAPAPEDNDNEKKKATSEETKVSLEAIKLEQRKVLVGTTSGFVKLVRDARAFESIPVEDERDELAWQAWWARAWYREFARLVSLEALKCCLEKQIDLRSLLNPFLLQFSKHLAAHQVTIEASVFPDEGEGDPARDIFVRACQFADE